MKTKNSALGLIVKNAGVKIDVAGVSDAGVIEGYGSVWGVVDSYNEVVVKGAFTASLAKSKASGRSIKMLYQHDTYTPIGVWDDVSEDETGLRVKGRLLKDVSPKAMEVFGLMKEGALDELSIGYREIETKKDLTRPGVLLLEQLDLKEISPVTFGALGQVARVDTIKSILTTGDGMSVRQFEDFLRDSGFSRRQATAIAAKAAPYLRGEPEATENDALEFLRALRA